MTAPLRPLRAAIAGLTCTVGAAVAHAAAGAGLPTTAALLGTAALSTTVALALSNRRLDPSALLALALASQGVLHTVFHGSGATGGSTAAMVAAHVVSAMVTTAVATGAESAIWQLVQRLIRHLTPSLHLPPLCSVWSDPVADVPRPKGRLWVFEAPDRGPPALICF